MKKRQFIISALALGAASILLTGFDNNATVDDVLEKYTQAAQEAMQFSADAGINADIDITIAPEGEETQSASIKVQGDMDIALTKDPISFAVNADVTATMPGEDEASGMVRLYSAEADSALDLYVGFSNEWEYTTLPAEQLDQIKAALAQSAYDPSATIGTYTLAEGSFEVSGRTCYQLLNQITYGDIRPIVEEALKSTGEEMDDATLSMLAIALNNLYFNTETYVDAETYLPVKTRIDMAGSDFSMISTILAFQYSYQDSEGNLNIPEISLDVNELALEVFYDYESPVEINIPAEALAKKANGEALDLDALTDTALGEIAS